MVDATLLSALDSGGGTEMTRADWVDVRRKGLEKAAQERLTDLDVPASLPPIDTVDVVDLSDVGIAAYGFATEAADAPFVKVGGREAQRVAGLWRALPPGEQARCHVPPFGLRFYAEDVVVAQASICWHCNNLFGEAGGRDMFYAFDGDADVARELLSLLEQIIGHPVTE